MLRIGAAHGIIAATIEHTYGYVMTHGGDKMPGPIIVEMHCKSMLNRVNVSYLPFRWSVNPYRGCVHACVYCYACRYHEYLDLDPGAGFDRQVFVKVNGVQVLRRGWPRAGAGNESPSAPPSMRTGPRKESTGSHGVFSEAFAEFDTPCSIMTKNTMIVRDVDVFATWRPVPA